ncbi:MAG: DUF4097 family beta strand repeat-containing protein [Candidatus Izimaplasma sp.]|nr:DUF4097 family beta strand repeat-containing protein [Candidatus Izimaplasma bacterium]
MKIFLENLKKELNKYNFSTEEINEIINDHEEMIQSALDDGLDENKINEKLGDPEKIAKELSADANEPKSSSVSLELLKTLETDTIKKINIDLLEEDLTFELGDGDNLEIYGKKIKMNDYDIEVVDSVLNLSRKKEKSSISFSFKSSSKEFLIKFPKGFETESFELKTKSSDVEINDLTTNNLDIKNISGDIEIDKLNTNTFNIKNISGDIELSSSNINNLSTSNVSGDIEIRNCDIKNSLKINSVSGDVEIENSQTKDLYYNSVSGDLETKEYYPENATLKSVTGDIEFKNKDKSKNINIISKKSLKGDINL